MHVVKNHRSLAKRLAAFLSQSDRNTFSKEITNNHMGKGLKEERSVNRE